MEQLHFHLKHWFGVTLNAVWDLFQGYSASTVPEKKPERSLWGDAISWPSSAEGPTVMIHSAKCVCVCPVRDWQPVRSLTKTGSCMGTRDTNKQQSQLAEQENASWNLFFSFIMCSRFKAEGQQDIYVFMLSTERLFFLIPASAEMLRVIISLSAFCQTTGSTSNAHESRRVSTFWFEPFLTHMCRFLTHEQDEAWLAGSLLAGPGWQQNVSIRVRVWIWPHQTCWRLSCSFNYWIIVKVIFSAQLNKMLQSSRETQTTNYCQSSSNSVARVKWHQ